VCFESESSFREIRFQVFAGSLFLGAILIPASVRKMDGSAFMGSYSRSIEVASDSPSFRTDGPFLLDSHRGLVRYESDLTISRGIVALRRGCFSGWTNLRSLLFESESTLAELEAFVFDDCSDLELIDFPASLVKVHGSAFVKANIAYISIDRLMIIPDERPK
jgi:hypothetical protein